MKIISKYKDYYDYLSGQYGEDPLCTYVRNSIDVDKIRADTIRSVSRELSQPLSNDREYHYLFAGKYLIPYVLTKGNWHVDPELRTPDKLELYVKSHHMPIFIGERKYRYFLLEEKLAPTVLPENKILEIVKKIGHPVFVIKPLSYSSNIDSHYRSALDENIPVLADWKVPTVISPTEMWQNLSTVIMSVLRKDIDKQPPFEVNNEEKILAHGFDLKTSFRKSKTGPKPKSKEK